MKFKRRILDEPSINLTPLIDVVFLLLIFFMVTTTFTRETLLQVNLPEAEAETQSTQTERLEIVVSRNGSFALNGQTLVNGKLETLLRGLELESKGNLNLPVIIVADSEATHQSVVTAMDAIGQAGFTRLSIATQRSEQSDIQDQIIDDSTIWSIFIKSWVGALSSAFSLRDSSQGGHVVWLAGFCCFCCLRPCCYPVAGLDS